MLDELEAVLSENANLFKTCEHLTRQRVTVAKALEQNLTLCIERNKAAEKELHEIEEEVEEKESVISRTKSLVSELCHCGFDLSSSGCLNVDYYLHLFQGNLPGRVEGCEQLDPIVHHIVSTIPYFRMCDSNDSFVEKCAELMTEISDQPDSISHGRFESAEDDSEKKVRHEQIAFQHEFAQKMIRTKRLIDEQGRLHFTHCRTT
jgi:hypothetical protein